MRLVEYPAGGYAVRQQGDYTYDDQSNLTRFDFSHYEPIEGGGERLVQTYYSTFEWSGGFRRRGEVWIRYGDGFVQSKDLDYEYDGAGRLSVVTVTQLLDMNFQPIRAEGRQRYEYDDAGRLVGVRWDGETTRVELIYDENGNVTRELLHGPDGDVVAASHTYDGHPNPFIGLPGHGTIRVTSNWAELVSARSVVLTENSANGGAVISRREVEVFDYHDSGYPAKSAQYLRNTQSPDEVTAFVAEYSYDLR